MSYFKTKYQRQSARITSVIGFLILILLFLVGLSYFEPPLEYGMEVNFGVAETGSGNRQPTRPIRSAPKKTVVTPPKEEVKPEPVKEPEAKPVEDEVLTEENTEVPIDTKKEEKVEEVPKETKTEEKVEPEEEKIEEKRPDPTPSQSTKEALERLINSTPNNGTATTSEGDDKTPGDKGKPNGDPYANSYYGDPGPGGSGKGYGLNGRSLVNSGKVQQDCNEEGTVVVEIEVDRNGKVIKATPGVRGTTNNHPCLLEPAKKTAFLHSWNFDDKAPSRQVGFVEVNFRLRD